MVGSSKGYFAGDTDIAVTNAATNYVMIDSNGNIVISTSARNDDYARLAKVTASGGAITAIEDARAHTVG